MKNLFLTILFSGLALSMFGQRAGHTLLALNFGANIPVGDFNSTDLENESAGFANTGVMLNMTALYKVSRKIGVGGMFAGHTNWANNAAYQSAFQQAYPDIEVWSIVAERWASGGLLAGAAATLPLGSKMDFMIKAFAGGVLAYTPRVEIVGGVNDEDAYKWTREQDKAGAFAFDVGASLMLETGEKQYFIVSAEYFYTKPSFDDFKVLEYEDPEEPPVITSRTYSPTLSSFNIMVGFGYYL